MKAFITLILSYFYFMSYLLHFKFYPLSLISNHWRLLRDMSRHIFLNEILCCFKHFFNFIFILFMFLLLLVFLPFFIYHRFILEILTSM